MRKLFIVVVVVIVLAIIGGGVWWYMGNSAPETRTTVSYMCADNKSLTATYIEKAGVAPTVGPNGEPVPTGSVALSLSDGRAISLPQTISGSGIRYANTNETFVFWSKGNGAFIEEGATAASTTQTYAGCITVAGDPTGRLPQVYSDPMGGFSIRYPAGYAAAEIIGHNVYAAGEQDMGVTLAIPSSMATGTNLAPDSGVSVQMLQNTPQCDATAFFPDRSDLHSTSVTEGGTTYSFATSSDAGAGNIYEETVYAIPGSNPCIGVHYFVHSMQIGNYPKGMVHAFDRVGLLGQFDIIRRSLTVGQ